MCISICNDFEPWMSTPDPDKFGSKSCESLGECEYTEMKRLNYGGAVFIPVCIKCHRYVKPDDTVSVNEEYGLVKQPNATCSKCGRTWMHFEGFFSEEELN